MYAIGVDSGTQGTKILLIDFNGLVLGRGYAPHTSIREGLKAGESEQDPLVWVAALETALQETLNQAQIDPKKIVCLGVSGQQHGFVPLDREGHVIRPAKLWNDTSTVAETELLLEKLGGAKNYIAKLGIHLAVGYTASKILWMKRHEPENFRKLHTVLLPHNFINFVLTGKAHMEYGDASGTGLMDIKKLTWHPEAVAAVDPGLQSCLPHLSHPSEPVGFIQKKFATRFGLGDVLVSSGGGDNMMGAVGTGNVFTGVTTLSLGTSGTLYCFSESPIVDEQGEIAAFCSSTGGWLPLLCTMNVTNTTEHLKALLSLSNTELENLAASAPVGANNLLFLPFIDGERVPALPEASGVFFGLTKDSFNPSCLARSVLEGTLLNLGYGFARLKSLSIVPEEIRATGGGSKNRFWLQIASDIFQTPLTKLEENEAAAFGAALQSLWSYLIHQKGEALSLKDLTDRIVKRSGELIEPDRKTFPIYEDLQGRFNDLWHTLWPKSSGGRDFGA